MHHIHIRNARIHNLKQIDLDIPRGCLVAITGVSGSGKSSLAFDLLFEEGRRRYLLAAGLPFAVAETGRNLSELVPALVTFRDLRRTLPDFCKVYGVLPDTRYGDLSPDAQHAFLHGSARTAFPGLLTTLAHVGFQEGQGRAVARRLGYGEEVPCPSCAGYRIGDEARAVTLSGLHIGKLGLMTVAELGRFLEGCHLPASVPGELLRLTRAGVQQLIDVGLGHLTLYRSVPTLSGGELQRLFLMAHLDPALDGLTYIFDEPTTGLHELEKERLVAKLRALAERGASVIVVEHDLSVLRAADHIIEMGPGAGTAGGQVIAEGAPPDLRIHTDSQIGRFLQIHP